MNYQFIANFSQSLLKFFHKELPYVGSMIILLETQSVPRQQFVTFLNQEL